MSTIDASNPAARILPYSNDERRKTQQIASMFDGIAHRYDALNRLISLGLDRRWRRQALAMLATARPRSVLDVATGTGDLVVEMDQIFHPDTITGVDLSEEMLALARRKTQDDASIGARLEFQQADIARLPFAEGSFDAVTVSFGVRNFEHLRMSLAEMLRVLRPGGRCMILEFSTPRKPVVVMGHTLAVKVFVPLVGRLLSRDPAAYRYLPKSVAAFPQGEEFAALMMAVGCERVVTRKLRPGVCTVYLGSKP
ncbi:MAG TPA: bifunctional demethylmenaquinone methyltransferase/2-methoxy-6-polyprenyl-1,4-benzoquinol methylase UbiE [Solirubrobacteraceae bacterium]